jgi:hypothetical protein
MGLANRTTSVVDPELRLMPFCTFDIVMYDTIVFIFAEYLG